MHIHRAITPSGPSLARRSRLVAGLAAALALLTPTSAHAIVYGEPDAGHPQVGSLISLYDPGTGAEPYPVQLCTGTLVAARVVLTASHCVQRDELPPQYVGEPWFTLDEIIDGDGDWVVDATVTRLAGEARPHPLYASHHNYRYDVGAFVLDEPVVGVTPAMVAPVGTLDDRSLRGVRFTAVGYGIVRDTNKQSTQSFLPPQRRMKATQSIASVTRDFVTFTMNLATGNGGTCYGDSGGPHYLGEEIVAITTTGDIPCKATDKDFRVDTAVAHEFLAAVISSTQAP